MHVTTTRSAKRRPDRHADIRRELGWHALPEEPLPVPPRSKRVAAPVHHDTRRL